jgi:hypothetical protein
MDINGPIALLFLEHPNIGNSQQRTLKYSKSVANKEVG